MGPSCRRRAARRVWGALLRREVSPAVAATGHESLDQVLSVALVGQGPRLDGAVAVAVTGLDVPDHFTFEPDVAPCEASESAVPPPLHQLHDSSVERSFEHVKLIALRV